MSSLEANEAMIVNIENEDTTPLEKPAEIKREYLNISGAQSDLVDRGFEGNLDVKNRYIYFIFT